MTIDNAAETLSREELYKTISKLRKENKELSRKKKFGLVWENKPDAQVERIYEEAPMLREDTSRAVVTDEEAINHVLINGDNFHALTALRASHSNKVDVIYIDPPYNTGNKDFIYNDAFLDSEDGYRHSKWLSFMEKRLRLARELLSDTGVIFVSIDDNEQARLKLLMDEVFGPENFVANMIWKSRTSANDNVNNSSTNHEYILTYSKIHSMLQLRGEKKDLSIYKNPDNDPRGDWKSFDPSAASGTEKYRYNITNPLTGEIYHAPKNRYWAFPESRVLEWTESGRMVFPKIVGKRFTLKKYVSELRTNALPVSSLKFVEEDTIPTSIASRNLKSILNEENFFKYSKPVEVMKKLINLHVNNNAIILDFFAGSGTTAHAVAELNKEDGGRRQCILVTDGGKTEETGHSGSNAKGDTVNIAEEITYERVRRVLTGADWADGKAHEPLGGNLRYFNVEMNHVQGASKVGQHIALEGYTPDHASIAENAFTLVDEKSVNDEDDAIFLNYKVFSATENGIARYVVGVENHDYQMEELGKWFATLPEDSDVTLIGVGLDEVDWVKENIARLNVYDLMSKVIESRRYVASTMIY